MEIHFKEGAKFLVERNSGTVDEYVATGKWQSIGDDVKRIVTDC